MSLNSKSNVSLDRSCRLKRESGADGKDLRAASQPEDEADRVANESSLERISAHLVGPSLSIWSSTLAASSRLARTRFGGTHSKSNHFNRLAGMAPATPARLMPPANISGNRRSQARLCLADPDRRKEKQQTDRQSVRINSHSLARFLASRLIVLDAR